MRSAVLAVSLFALGIAAPVLAAPVMMSADWAKEACEAWNRDPVLTDKLVPVTRLYTTPLVMVVHPSLPGTMKEYVELVESLK